jgi:histidine triad (HIT) family protein
MSTVFTKIIEGQIPGRFLWQDDVVVAFLTHAPISPGHALIVPRTPFVQYVDAPDYVLAHLSRVTKAIGRAQLSVWPAPRAAVLVAGFEVPHLHIHVLPAWDESHLTFANARTDVRPEDLDAAAEQVRSALHAQGHGDRVPTSVGALD